MNSAALSTFWRFIRGDMSPGDFEAWLYAHETLEAMLGEPFYLELVSFDYRDQRALFVFRERLAARLRPALECECVTLPDLAVVPMGFDDQDARVFATHQRVRDHGDALWWLHLSKCGSCGQDWMVAQEERIFDNYFLKRLTAAEAGQIVSEDRWPADFMTYEKVLSLGHALSSPFQFPDPLAGGLVWTARELRDERPGITTEEIARLIGATPEQVERMLATPVG